MSTINHEQPNIHYEQKGHFDITLWSCAARYTQNHQLSLLYIIICTKNSKLEMKYVVAI